ncbi:MAG: 2-oxoacid:ferredoxin oxidoreductase subunit beta [Spirochaetaceae bacterium]|nr:2-oxoacid:ferredoxin oxidoreductase subunit beta [Spirochaetaceae bacterium]
MATANDFKNDVKPNWCPGCGDYGVLAAIQKAAANCGIEPHQLALSTGIGCSGRLAGYVRSYGVHGLHGRALPVAQGIKMANRELTVIAAGGDGDGFAIGTNHTVHAMRRNIDMTYIVMDNQIYGLTKGQMSPRSDIGQITNSSPTGSVERPISSVQLALASGATFVAQSFSSDLNQMTDIIEKAINHKGFSLVVIYSPCPTYNKTNDVQWYKERLSNVADIAGYNPSDITAAFKAITEKEGWLTGVLYQKEMASYQEVVKGYAPEALVKADLNLSEDLFYNTLVKEYI